LVRRRYGRLRAVLQQKGVKDAKEKLRKISGRERRFKTNTNHVVSKRIVCATGDAKRGIALEDLTGILQWTTVTKTRHERGITGGRSIRSDPSSSTRPDGPGFW
jgi:hypothetical protein